jgi:hypothetical protein
MVFNATFNNISVILWRSDLLVEETGLPGENHQPATSQLTLSGVGAPGGSNQGLSNWYLLLFR